MRLTAFVSTRVGIRFCLGGLLGFLVIYLLEGPARNFSRQLLPWLGGAPGLLMPAVGFFVSGVVGGAALRSGRLATLGFGLAFMLTSPIWLLTIIGIQGMGTNQSLFAELSLGFVLGFGAAGAVGSVFLRRGVRMVVVGAAAFGVAAVVGAAIVSLPFVMIGGGMNHGGIGRQAETRILFTAMVLGPLVTYFLGGALLGAQLERLQSLPRKLEA